MRNFVNTTCDYILLVPFQIVSALGLILILTNILFVFDQPISSFILPISLCVAILLSFFCFKEKFERKNSLGPFLLLTGVTIILMIFSVFIMSKIYDTSYDGQTYHQQMIIALRDEGWIPLKQSSYRKEGYLWLEHYPKGSAILAASIYSITNVIETGKSVGLFLLIAAFFTSFSVAKEIFKKSILKSFFIAFVASLNPVVVYQIFSNYVDGRVYSLILMSIGFAIYFIYKKKSFYLIPFLIGIILLISFKFTAIFYAVLLCIGLLVSLYILKKKLKLILKPMLLCLVTGLFAVFFINLNPYYYNWIDYKHPFYPIMGENSIDFMSTNTPEEYKILTNTEKFFVSHFGLNIDREKIQKRIPFIVPEKNLTILRTVDPRFSGFGPFFMELSYLSLMISVLFLIQKNLIKEKKLLILLMYILLFLSIIIMPENWWARYIPQMYLILVIPLYVVPEKSFNLNFLNSLVIAFLLLNSIYTGYFYFKKVRKDTISITNAIEDLKKEERTLYIRELGKYRFDKFNTNITRFNENNLFYTVIEDENEWNKLEKGDLPFIWSPFEIRFR